MMSEKFVLQWSDFHSNFSNSFGNLNTEEYLHDITLVTDDHQQVSAHKLILSISSEYFQAVFRQNRSSNLMLCLEGVTKDDLNNCLSYMYNGQVQIHQEELDRFLNVAQRFKIKGLLDEGINEKNQSEDGYENMTDYLNERTVRSNNSDHNGGKVNTQLGNEVLKLNKGYDMKRDTEEYIERLNGDENVKCKICGKLSFGKAAHSIKVRDMKLHIETHMEGLSYPCPSCDKICRSTISLKNHKYAKHRV